MVLLIEVNKQMLEFIRFFRGFLLGFVIFGLYYLLTTNYNIDDCIASIIAVMAAMTADLIYVMISRKILHKLYGA